MLSEDIIITIALVVIVSVLLVRYLRSREGFADTPATSQEALANIASLYNGKKMVIQDIDITGKMTIGKTVIDGVTGDVVVNGITKIDGATGAVTSTAAITSTAGVSGKSITATEVVTTPAVKNPGKGLMLQNTMYVNEYGNWEHVGILGDCPFLIWKTGEGRRFCG